MRTLVLSGCLLTAGGRSPRHFLLAWQWPCWPRCAIHPGGNAETPEHPVGYGTQRHKYQLVPLPLLQNWEKPWEVALIAVQELTCIPQIWEHISGSEFWIQTGWPPHCWTTSTWSVSAWQILTEKRNSSYAHTGNSTVLKHSNVFK